MKVELNVRIRAVLNTQWNPIGVYGEAPEDEYDEYAIALDAIVAHGASVADVARYLLAVETGRMCLAGDAKRAKRVAAQIVGLYGS